jgi:hypothetical protein
MYRIKKEQNIPEMLIYFTDIVSFNIKNYYKTITDFFVGNILQKMM